MKFNFGPLKVLKNFWGTLNSTQKLISSIFLSLSIVLLVVVSIIASRPQMSVLFSGLQANDAGTIISKLQEQGINYKVDGSSIQVPEKDVHELRIKLASEGLPENGNVGFELFDKSNLGMTEFSQKLNYQRALQGELAKTIDGIEGVEVSRVHLALPEKSLFLDKGNDPSASIVLKLRSGKKLNADETAGIVHLVASSVENLKPNNITVVDTRGNLLSEPGDDLTGLDARLSTTQLKIKQEYENQVIQDIQTMLAQIVGPDKSIVRVNAKINCDRQETSKEIYQPGGAGQPVASSTQETKEIYGNSNGPASSKMPAALTGVAGSPSGKGGYERTETNSKFQVSKTIDHIVKSPGQIEKLSVAVVVDDKVSNDKIPSIRNAVMIAAGIDLTRGDQIAVERINFDTTAAKQEEKDMRSLAARDMYMSYGAKAAGILLLLGFLMFLRKIIGQIKSPSTADVTVEDITPNHLNALRGYTAALETSGQANLSGAANPAVDNSAAVVAEQVIADTSPEDIARVLRQWMSEN